MNNKLLKVKNIRISTSIGKHYQIVLRNLSGKNRDSIRYSPFEGKLIQDTVDFLTFKHSEDNYCESFLKVDFAIKYYEIREKRGDRGWTEPLEIKY